MSTDQGSAGLKHRRRLFAALGLTATYMVVEATAGFLANSLVLIADAGHMLSDVAGLSLALTAIWFAQRPPTPRKTFGYYRAEILAAVVNAMLLFAISGYILYEAYTRLVAPPEVASVPLLVVASMGLVVNLASARLLMSGAGESMNVRGAFLEVVSDLLGSVGAIAAGVILLTTGWKYADPLFAGFVGLFILPRTWLLLRGALDVLFEGTPAHIDINAVREAIIAQQGVEAVHDLHVWSVTSGFIALSGHVQVGDAADRDALLVSLRRELRSRFQIEHVTIQVENDQLSAELGQDCFPETSPWDGRRPSSKRAGT
ncbi:MAG: cation transporter [Dehalococcoidia bacterium]|nr:cation transporter [Dehalococcoidia bacterium]